MRQTTENPELPHELLAFAFLLAAGTFAVLTVLYLGKTPAVPLRFAAGAYVCFLLGHLDSLEVRPALDYLHTGSAAFLTICALISCRFFASPLLIVFILPIAAVLFEFYARRFLVIGGRDLALTGIVLNVLFAMLLLFLFRVDQGFDAAALSRLFSGYAGTLMEGAAIPATILFVCLITHIFVGLAEPELKLLSYGRAYFEGTGLRYGPVRNALLIARGVLTAGTMLLSGWMGGAALMGRDEYVIQREIARDLSILAQYLCLAQVLLFVSALISPLVVVPVWLGASGILYIFKHFRRISPNA